VAREGHFLEQMRRFKAAGKGSISKRQAMAVWNKVHDLPDESVTGIVDHFLKACRGIPDLRVWDELVAQERRLLDKRRLEDERREREKRFEDADKAAQVLTPEQIRANKDRVVKILSGMMAGKTIEPVQGEEA
jgi:hypothetical protein